MATSRFQMASNKKTALIQQQKREIASMLKQDPPKEEKARIRAEALIREDNCVEAYEILMLNCELLAERIKLITSSKDCPPDLVSSISTILWASDRVDINELSFIRKQFRYKFGKEFEARAMNNVGGILNDRVVSKLSVQPPAAYLVQVYLERICEELHVNWQPKVKVAAENMADPMSAPVGYSVQVAGASGLGEVTGYEPDSSGKVDPLQPPTPSATATPVVSSMPYVPPSPASSHYAPSPSAGSHFEEPDIYVPAVPTAPSVQDESGPDDKKNDNDDNDDEYPMPPPAPGASGSGAGGASYDDLAARFQQLKK